MIVPKINNPKYWENGIVCDINSYNNASKFNTKLYKSDVETYFSYLGEPKVIDMKGYKKPKTFVPENITLNKEQQEYFDILDLKKYSENQIIYTAGYKAGNKKTLLEFGIWVLIGFVLGIVTITLSTLL